MPIYSDKPLTQATTIATTSGTAADFTGISASAKRITVMFNGVGFAASAQPILQLGSGAVQTTGYTAMNAAIDGAVIPTVSISATSGFSLSDFSRVAGSLWTGVVTLTKQGANKWQMTYTGYLGATAMLFTGTGIVTLSGEIDRLRLAGGGATFNAGAVNVMWE